MSARLRSRLAVAAPPLVSLLIGAVVHARVSMALPVADAYVYNITAKGLAGQNTDPAFGLHWAIGNVFERGIYPAFVGTVYGLAGSPRPDVVGWIQALVLVPLTTFLIYVAGREGFSRRVGLVSAWAFALWLPAQWYTLWLMTESLTDLLLALSLALLAALLVRRSTVLALAAGLSLGVVSIAHPAYQLVPIVVVVALVVHFLVLERRLLRLAALVTLGICAVQIPHLVAMDAASLPSLGQGGTGLEEGAGWTFWATSRAETDFVPVPDDYLVAQLSSDQLPALARYAERGQIHIEPHLLAIIRRKAQSPDPAARKLTDSDYYRAGVENLLARPGRWPQKIEGNADRLFLLPDELQLYRDRPLTADWRTRKWPFYDRGHLTRSTWFLRPWRALGALLLAGAFSGLALVLLRRRDRLVLFVPLLFQVALVIAILTEWRRVIPLWSSMFVLAGVGTFGWLEARSTAFETAETAGQS